MPQVQTTQDNAQLTLVLQRLVDEHGAAPHLSDILFMLSGCIPDLY